MTIPPDYMGPTVAPTGRNVDASARAPQSAQTIVRITFTDLRTGFVELCTVRGFVICQRSDPP